MVKPRFENETPEERFKRLASARTENVIEKIRILSNCANRQRYSYTKKQVDTIFKTIQKELEIAKYKYEIVEKIKFKL